VATKISLKTFPPLSLGMVRFGLAAVLLGLYLAIRGKINKPAPADFVKLVLSGFTGITVYFSLENIGVKYSTAADAALIIASYPAIIMALESLFFRVRFTALSYAGVGLAVIGVYLIASVSQSSNDGVDRLLGNILLILAGFVWAGYNFITRGLVSNYPMATITFYQISAGAIGFLPLIFFEINHWTSPAADSLMAVVYLALFCSLFAFYLYAYGLRQVRSSFAVILMNLVPIFGVIFSMLILREEILFQQILGGIITIIGVLLSVLSAEKEKT